LGVCAWLSVCSTPILCLRFRTRGILIHDFAVVFFDLPMILVYFISLTGRVRVRSQWVILSIVMSTTAFAGEFTGKVIGIADGDTITVLHVDGDAKTPIKVRLAGIDTPEKAQDYGAKAKKALSSQIHGETVKVVYTEKDR
jgi:endonuclease YncB( thermonuclease family)